MRAVRMFAALAVLVSVVAVGSAAAPVGGPGTYIVVLDPGAPNAEATARRLVQAHGGELGFVYSHALQGFSARLSPRAAAALASNPLVASVEPDQPVQLAAQDLPTGIERIFADDNPSLGLDATDDLRVDVDVAVIDTGIDPNHPDLDVVASVNCSGGSPFKQSCGTGGSDDNGHGTHVAGTIAAIDDDAGVVGVAPGASLWSVKVLRSDGSGYLSWIIAGIDYVTGRAGQIEVANMSLGCECSSAAMDQAITNSVAAGVAYAVAAGNSDKDASTFSPGNHPDVLTVSALADFDGRPGGLGSPTCRADEDDTLANFSNFGRDVEIAAPGVCIRSTWPGGGYATISGTSMASPHAAGALALLASSNPPSNRSQVRSLYSTLVSEGNLDWTDDSGDGVKERLLDVGDSAVFAPATVAGSGGGGGGGNDTTAPAAPAGLSATPGDGSVAIDWADNAEPDLAGYVVYRRADSEADFTAVASPTGSSYTDTAVANGTTYHYRVTAVDDTGNESDPSGVVSATPEAGGGGGGGITLTGSSVNNGSTWTATVTVSGAGAGATVTGTWDDGTTGGCTADGGGTCAIVRSSIPKRVGSVTFTLATGEAVTVSKP